MNEKLDRFTGKPIDCPSDSLPSFNGGTCETCGCETIDRCAQCGAPQCCPNCCNEDMERLFDNEDEVPIYD